MALNDNELEKVEAYLKGEMTEEERSDFESQLSQNPELQQEVEAYRLVFTRLRRMAIRQKIRKLEAELPPLELNSEQFPTQAPKRKPRILQLGLAASLAAALLILLWITFFNPFTPRYTEQTLLFYEFPDVRRSMGVEEGEETYQNGLTAFKDNKFTEAIQFFDRVGSSSKDFTNAQYLAGHSYFRLGKFSMAAQKWEKVRTDDALLDLAVKDLDEYRQASSKDVQWYLALAYLAGRQNRKGIALLDTVLVDPFNVFYFRAKDLSLSIPAEIPKDIDPLMAFQNKAYISPLFSERRDGEANLLANAINKFERDSFQKSLDLLGRVSTADSFYLLTEYCKGHNLYHLKRYEDAELAFQIVIDNQQNPLYSKEDISFDNAAWMILLARLGRLNQTYSREENEALQLKIRQFLDRFIFRDDEYHYRAERLLEFLKREKK